MLSGGAEGDIGQALARGRDEEAVRCLARWQGLCGDRFYLEVQRTGRAGESAYSEAVMELARAHGVAAVATNDVRFLDARGVRGARGAGLHPRRRAARRCEPARGATPRSNISKRRRRWPSCSPTRPSCSRTRVEIAKRCSLRDRWAPPCCRPIRCRPGSTTEGFLREEAARGLAGAARRRRSRCAAAERDGSRRTTRGWSSSSASSAAWASPDTS